MKRTLLVLSLLLTTLLTQAQMSDIQVMQYVQREMKNGSSQSQIATKLMQKGVTMQQLQRVRSQYEKQSPCPHIRRIQCRPCARQSPGTSEGTATA